MTTVTSDAKMPPPDGKTLKITTPPDRKTFKLPTQENLEDQSWTLWDHLKQLWDTARIMAFVLGSALIVFIAARNTITWHLQRFWGASGNFWQSNWDVLYKSVFCGDVIGMGVWGTLVITSVVFFGFNSFLMFLDLTGKPEYLVRYKIQDEKEVPLNPTSFKRCLKTVLFNAFVMNIPIVYGLNRIMYWRGCDFGPTLPTFHWVVVELAVFILMEELGFYYSHRLLHHPLLYKHIHKKHHEWTASIGIVAIYAHPVEHFISNMLPPALGPLLMGSHVTTSWLWFCMALMSTSLSHSGYHFPFLPSSEAHDFHHYKFTNNFGVLGILDHLHGTDLNFRASKAYERHYMSLSLAPLRQLHPDDPKSNKGKAKLGKMTE